VNATAVANDLQKAMKEVKKNIALTGNWNVIWRKLNT
jgi:hypothetical protein